MGFIRWGARLGDLVEGDKLPNPVLTKALAGAAAGIGAERHYTVLGEDFTVKLDQTPKKWVSSLTDPLEALFSTLYAGSIFHFSEKLQIQRRAEDVARALQVFNGEATVLDATLGSINDDISLLALTDDLDDAKRLQAQITAKTLKAQRLNRAMENNINALLYLGRAESDDILLEQLRQANLEDNADDLKVWQSWINDPPTGIVDEDLLGILNNLADPDDLFGIKQSVNKSKAATDEIIELLTRTEAFTTQADALLARGLATDNIDELGKALKSLGQGSVSSQLLSTQDDLKNVQTTMKNIASASENARKIGSRASFAAKTVGRFFFWDTAYWIVTLGIDVALNPFLPEDKQRIPYLADLPIIGGLFDVSDSAGTSVVDLLINWGLGKVIDWFVPDTVAQSFYELLYSSVDAEDLGVWYLAVLTFFYDFDIDLIIPDLTFQLPDLVVSQEFKLPVGSIETLDILAVATVACVGKIVFNGWIRPAWTALQSTVARTT